MLLKGEEKLSVEEQEEEEKMEKTHRANARAMYINRWDRRFLDRKELFSFFAHAFLASFPDNSSFFPRIHLHLPTPH